MATSPTPRLGLLRPLAGGHGFSRDEYYDNLGVIDGFPGTFICTSVTRPAGWGSAHTGMTIWETDTNLAWRWTGSAWARLFPKGLLNVSQRVTDFATAATTPASAVSVDVSVPDGSATRRILVHAEWYAIENGSDTQYGSAEVSLLRGSTLLTGKRVVGRPDTDTDYLDWGIGGSISFYDDPSAGAATYHLAINSIAAVGGTTTLIASSTTPAQIAVREVGT